MVVVVGWWVVVGVEGENRDSLALVNMDSTEIRDISYFFSSPENNRA